MAARDDVLLLTCGTVLVTLVPVGLALPWLVRVLGVAQTDDALRRYVDARQRLAHAALDRAEDLAGDEDAPERLLARAREAYELRIARLEQSLPDREHADADAAETYRHLRRQLLEAEQEALVELRDSNVVSGDTLRAVQRDLDLEAARLDR